MSKIEIIVIADPHLGMKEGDIESIIEFIRSLKPSLTHLIFLGDVFHIWAAPKKYHYDKVTLFLNALFDFRDAGAQLSLIVGNRDLFFPEIKSESKHSHLPFQRIANDFASFNDSKLLASHGDLVNSKDKSYLRWRKMIKSSLFKNIFGLMKDKVIVQLMFDLERNLKHTNKEFRLLFPKEEWEKYLEKVAIKFPQAALLIVGHFHPKQPILGKTRKITAIVVPDWLHERSYLRINQDLVWQHLKYS